MNEKEQLRWNTNIEALQPNHGAVFREAEHLSVDISLAISSFLSLCVLYLWLQHEASYGEITHEWNKCWHKENYFFALAPLYGQWIMKSCDPSSVLRPR